MGCTRSQSVQTNDKPKVKPKLKMCSEDNYILSVFHVDDDKLES